MSLYNLEEYDYEAVAMPLAAPMTAQQACDTARPILCGMDSHWCTANCTEMKNMVCGSPTIFTTCSGTDAAIRSGFGCPLSSCSGGGGGGGAADPNWCAKAKTAIKGAGGNWDGLTCSQVAAQICAQSSLFTGCSGDDAAIRSGAGCPLASCGGSTGGGTTNPTWCTLAKQKIKSAGGNWDGLTCDQVKQQVCSQPSLFTGCSGDDYTIRTGAGCTLSNCGGSGGGGGGGTTTPAWCTLARTKIKSAGGNWDNLSCDQVKQQICSQPTLFTGCSGDDYTIRTGAGCTLTNCGGGNGGGTTDTQKRCFVQPESDGKFSPVYYDGAGNFTFINGVSHVSQSVAENTVYNYAQCPGSGGGGGGGTDYCSQAKAGIRAAGGNWDSWSCDQVKAGICNDSTLFPGTNPIRTWAGCSGGGSANDPSWCVMARYGIKSAGGNWDALTCAQVSSHICSDNTLFTGCSGNDLAIRQGAGCPLSSCGGGEEPLECPDGYHVVNDVCVPIQCPTGYVLQGGQCVATSTPATGDNNMLLYGLIGAGALAGLALVLSKKKSVSMSEPPYE